MPLTRHLYREDEVAAALQFCMIKGRAQEACFWCLELLESGMVEELLLAMRRIWIYGVGLRGLHWMISFRELSEAEDLDADRCLQLVAHLCRLIRGGRMDTTVISLLERASGPEADIQPDRVNRGPTVCEVEDSPRARFLTLALLEGKTLAAWGAIRGISAPWELLGKVAENKHGGTGKEIVSSLQSFREEGEGGVGGGEGSNWEFLACAVGAISLTQKEFQRSWDSEPVLSSLSAEVSGPLKAWQEAVGRRARRVYPIPEDCLGWLTRRGRTLSVYDSNEKEILGRLEKPTALWGSEYWDTVVEEGGGWEAVRSSAEDREAFYATHFPDDIPDEWSAAERAKSHGSGVKQRGAAPDSVRWLKNWFAAADSAVFWKGIDAALKGLAARATEASVCAPWELWKGVGATDVTGWNWVPVVGRIVVPPGT